MLNRVINSYKISKKRVRKRLQIEKIALTSRWKSEREAIQTPFSDKYSSAIQLSKYSLLE